MKDWTGKGFKELYLGMVLAVFIMLALRAYFIPFSHDESATFFFYIQSGKFLPYHSFLYTNNHVLNSALSWICYELAGSHRFVLRLPNLFAFLVMAWALWRMLPHFKDKRVALLLLPFFLFNTGFLDFFSLCRGYGLSMALLILAFSCFLDYFRNPSTKPLMAMLISMQLALAANLTLLPLLLILSIGLLYVQFRKGLFFKLKPVLLNALNLVALFFWMKYLLFLKASNLLDSGLATHYWNTTFVSLIELLYGNKSLTLQVLFGLIALLAASAGFWTAWKSRKNNLPLFQPALFFTGLFFFMVISVYLMNRIIGINFPEDRTALYFYPLFALMCCFLAERFLAPVLWLIGPVFAGISAIGLILNFNLSHFHHYFYHTVPKVFYDRLLQESDQGRKTLTIGGHLNREMNYAFMNYRGGSRLNPMSPNAGMIMNCDYYIAQDFEKGYYASYYDEIEKDGVWGHRLLKRKEALKRDAIIRRNGLPLYCRSDREFTEFLRINDSSLAGRNALEADLLLYFKKVPAPFNAHLVCSVETEDNQHYYYSRVMLNWLEDDLSAKQRRIKMPLGPIPRNFKSLVLYLWNIDKQDFDLTLEELSVYELKGRGVNDSIPAAYYEQLYRLTLKPQL